MSGNDPVTVLCFYCRWTSREAHMNGWNEGITNALCYMEEHLTDELDIDKIAAKANVSSFYFQKIFCVLCGFTVGEYIRNRRLTLAGQELATKQGGSVQKLRTMRYRNSGRSILRVVRERSFAACTAYVWTMTERPLITLLQTIICHGMKCRKAMLQK
jgi:AraC-like DNA-binding protein